MPQASSTRHAGFVTDEVESPADAIAGAVDIIAEWISESEKGRSIVRAKFLRTAMISSKVVKGKEEEGRNYQNYHDFSEPLRTCTSHRYLAPAARRRRRIPENLHHH